MPVHECTNSSVCNEKFKYLDEKITELRRDVNDVNKKVDDVERKTDSLENALSNRLTQIETKFDVYNEMTNKKLDVLDKKMDKLSSVQTERQTTQQNAQPPADSFKEWLQKMGMKMLEYGMLSAILYGVGKGFNLF